ncbi:MAG: ThuA domain-containing protein [Bacteroidota bacterium]
MVKILFLAFLIPVALTISAQEPLQILSFQGDNGYEHDSKDEALRLVESLGIKNGWHIRTTRNTKDLNDTVLANIDVVIFNNNCGTEQAIFNKAQHLALQRYMRNDGGFMGIHCAGAIWHEEEEFQQWYEKLIGTRLVGHPETQNATLVVENKDHQVTEHLPQKWNVRDEWHYFSSNPRGRVNVLLSLDEGSYTAEPGQKMGGDHPFTWYHYVHGGRSFFTSLGHTEEIYHNADYQRMIEAAIHWASGRTAFDGPYPSKGLLLDLNADSLVATNAQDQVLRWGNSARYRSILDFRPNDYGIRITRPGSGRPSLRTNVPELAGHNSIVFQEDELINHNEAIFDHLITGSGYTWFALIRPYTTQNNDEETEFGQHRLTDVNSFLGNLKNGGNYEGIWGSLNDDLTVWCGSRNGITFGRFDKNNPKITGTRLEAGKYYIVAARMGSGTGTVPIELFVDHIHPVASGTYPVNIYANSSKLAIGTERDATNHPGSESFDGEIARLLLYERPLNDGEFKSILDYLGNTYGLMD